MEEERFLDLRRVQIAFRPQRTADELLTLAYQWLTRPGASPKSDGDRVQAETRRVRSQQPLLQEVVR